MSDKHPGGRPLRYKTPEALEEAIQEYFNKCKPEYVLDEEGKVMLSAKGTPVVKYNPPTVTGLALALGFNSRQALINYEGYGEQFHDTIKKAKLFIENYIEKGALVGDLHPVFSIFNLKNNYGWKEKQEIEHSGDMNVNIGKEFDGI